MQLTIRLLRETDGRWIADISELPGVTVYGATPEEATLKAKALALRVIAEEIEHGEMPPGGAAPEGEGAVVHVTNGRMLPLRPQPRYDPSMKLLVTLEADETGMLVAECPAIPGCVSQGRTEAEALDNIREAIAGCLATRAAHWMSPTIEVREVEVPA